jgi:multidrug efflux pump subunit AcrA (membrane-fusion protein)
MFQTSGPTQSATTGSASSVGASTATVNGTVDPSGLGTTYWFEYGTSAQSLSHSTAKTSAGAGTASLPVAATLTGLKPDATYFFTLVAANASGTSTGAEQTFATSANASPAVSTGSASGVSTTGLTLNGTLNPGGSQTTYWFEYGPTSSYGSKTAAVDAGAGTAAVAATAEATGLKPNTQYLFRLVARNAYGTIRGAAQVGRTAESSRTVDEANVTTSEQTVAHQEAALAQARQSLAQTQATIAAGAAPTAATIAQDEAAVVQAKATLAADRAALAQNVLKSPVAGFVTSINGSVGETVSGSGSTISRASDAASASSSSAAGAGASSGSGASGSGSTSSSAFMTIETLGKLQVVAGFAEADATKLAVGQPATVTFPALPSTEVAGRVTAVSSTSTVVSNVVTYDATITLVHPPAAVKEGMTANVSVVTQTRARALELPSAAITTNGTISTVTVLRNGKTTTKRIQTGLVGSSSTEIVSGLKVGDVVVLPTISVATSTTTTPTTGTFGGGGAFFGGGGFGGGGFGGGRGGG